MPLSAPRPPRRPRRALALPLALALALAGAASCRSNATPPRGRPVASAADARRAPAPAEPDPELAPALRETPVRPAAPRLPPPDARAPAPELSGGIAWLNTDRPLRMADLRGHVVLVDFWTYCCINCMHTLPVLAALEARHRGEPFVVVGVHSAKFPGEREADRIAEAIGRYDVRHPVVVDQENAIWRRWGVTGWPTLALVDARGRVVGLVSGEPPLERLDAIVTAVLDEGRREGALAARPIEIRAPRRADTGPLAYPGKVISLGGDRIAFTDSGHDRVVVARTDGAVEAVIGQGIPGRADGDFEHARFRRPQGLAAEPAAAGQAVTVLYVADTENHQVRRVDLASQRVTTIAGVGGLGQGLDDAPAPARVAQLRSPWDLARAGDRLYIAMAGSHQVWAMDPAGNSLALFAGSGDEARVDGVGNVAAFAQPSGLALAGDTLFVADSETSSVRAVELATRAVRTLVGQDLFVFGDVDGDATTARLQHPLGVATIPGEAGVVYVVDTYNHKVKRIDVATRTTRTLAGSARREPFFEPSGMAWAGTEFVVTDTNHHRLVRLSRDGRTATPIVFQGLRAPTAQTVEN